MYSRFGTLVPKELIISLRDEKETTSAIIGEVDIVDCVINHSSIWAEQSEINLMLGMKPIYNWVLANPVVYENPIINVKGMLSFWEFEK